MGFVFTNFQADNYGTSSGDDEGNCVDNWTGEEIRQYKNCRLGWGQAYKNNKDIKKAYENNKEINKGGGGDG